MKVKELIEQLQNCNPEDKVAVQIDKGFVTIGGTPRVGVESAHNGFDWDHGTVFLKLERGKMLTDISREEYTEHIRYKQLVSGMRGKQDIEHLSDIFVKKDFVINRLLRLVNVEELEPFEVSDLITDIREERL
ncbi:hypothetical protein CL97_gp213 [Cronobacter phage CR9]|uniref:Uncharacterized protein n=1 Tax=Cronobacter phage CR9 TaxID=1162290 RepID=M1F1D8_9CAUD|nr:hypothetical protein CL97_gp213 [Cronobacter phage CR9]AFH21097.1 hypothetical protein CR9_213 [Cronobacter phage CR9]